MCGITGFLSSAGDSSGEELSETVRRMADTLRLRGPDDEGVWADARTGVALGFRRLSIIDLSPAGHQPMESACGRYLIVFNGEVYNAAAIRAELEREGQAPPFRGHSDTEVMLAAIAARGLKAAVRSFVGMFAFALWDRQDRKLHLVRDRLGIKPLYYGRFGSIFMFGSDLSALRAHPVFRSNIDQDSLALYFRHNYIPAPYCIYQNVRKLTPGTILTIETGPGQDGRRQAGLDPEPVPYWSLLEVAVAGRSDPFTGSDSAAISEMDRLLRDAVGLRMIADVPLGAFLSGGIDSSTVVALMQAQSTRPVRTFSIGFHNDSYNEAAHAAAVAQHLGTDHTELYVAPAEAMEVIPLLPGLYTEPFADSSQIPTYLVSQLVRRDVTVSLSGDGGDELLGGYPRYKVAPAVWQRIKHIPAPLRPLISRLVGLAAKNGSVLPTELRDRIGKLGPLITAPDRERLYQHMVSYWAEPARLIGRGSEPNTSFTRSDVREALPDFLGWMLYCDSTTWLIEDVLAKVDRASMGVSLEARVPVLDHRVVEFAWTLPNHLKIRQGTGKWLLRQVLRQYVPHELFERPKMGFSVPLASWLRGPLRPWAEDLLTEARLKSHGFADPGPIRQRLAEHVSGHRDWQHSLWGILMFQAWAEHNRL